mgnify:CR=1 FL=1
MSELRRDGRELLGEARRERTPDLATRERVFEALMASAELAKAATTAPEPRVLTGVGKWLLLVVLAVAVAVGVYVAEHAGAKPATAPALR